MFQDTAELADLLMLVVHAVPAEAAPVSRRIPDKDVAAASSLAAGKEQIWRLELVYASGLSPEALVKLPLSTRTFCFGLSSSKPSVVLGRQHQMSMFEALLQNQKELLAFVSRSHLQMELAGEGELLVTNLSQNISIAGANILLRGTGMKMASGDVISFA